MSAIYRVRVPVEPPIEDAPGYDLKPKPEHAATAAEFMDAMRNLRTWAGEPSLRELASRCGGLPSHSTFGSMLKSSELPKLDLVRVFVDALGLPGDRKRWVDAWRRIALREAR